MLRAKQLVTLSQCARTFILSGSRCGSADGACTCPDDESSVSGRELRRTGFLYGQKKSILVSDVAARLGSPGLKDTVQAVGPQIPASHVPSPNSSLRSENLTHQSAEGKSVNTDFQDAQKYIIQTSKVTAEHLVKAGVATVGLLSEFVNQNIPAMDCVGLLRTQNCMVDSSHTFKGTKSSGGKHRKKTNYNKAQPKPAVSLGASSSSCPGRSDCSQYNAGNSGVMKAKHNVPMMAPAVSTESSKSQLVTQDQRHTTLQRGKSYSQSPLDTRTGVGIMEVNPDINETSKTVNRMQRPTRSSKVRGGRFAVEHYYQTLQQLKWGPTAEETLGNICYRLDAFQANQVLKLLQDHSVALGFFNWLKQQPGFKHDEHTYTTMVGILGRARQFGCLRRLMEEMTRSGCQPNVVTYNRLIHGYGRANYIDEAVNVFHQMQESGCKPDRVTYCTLIDIHAKAGYLEVAMDLYRNMQEAGLSPDTFTYSVMINCLGKAGHLSSAYRLFCEMVKQGCVPNLVTYNIMIALQAKSRNYPSALKLYRSMQAAGFRPDKITYSIVMEVLGNCGYLDEAEDLFVEMRQDLVPDEPVYGLLVDMWGKTGNVDKAQSWFQSMLDAGLRPNVPTCNSLLSAFLRAHRFSEAHDVLQRMLGLSLSPSLQTYTLLLSCCTETRTHMGLCGELMATTGHPAHTFLLSLPAAEPGGQNVRDHASAFLDIMHSEDRESKRGLVDAVIDFLHKSGLKEEAGSVWEVAVQRNVYPDAIREKRSSYWLINLHVMSDGTAVIALSRTLAWFRRQMLVSGVGPTRIDIITGWGRRSRVTGSSLVRQAVGELLHLFRFPFYAENGNSGCFVGCGEALQSWLFHSYVERMHLL
uniref:Pentatricopeptide repeat-containing protein At1g74750 n=1 Tax=Anthurium amnicola TaxID=1678845 RepID=A0A1D1Y6B3_9ARAE